MNRIITAIIGLLVAVSVAHAEELETNAPGAEAQTADTQPTDAAQTNERNLKFYIGMGLDFGGDELADVDFTDGGSDSVKAGDGISFDIGLDYHIGTQYMVRGTIGTKSDSVDAENGSISFERDQLTLMGYRFFGQHGVGVGMLKHQSAEFDCDLDFICDDSVDAGDASGVLLEYLYRNQNEGANVGFTGGIRVSSGISYKPDVPGAESADGDFVGFTVGLFF